MTIPNDTLGRVAGYLLVAFGAGLLSYIIAVFVTQEPDPREWTSIARATAVFLWVYVLREALEYAEE